MSIPERDPWLIARLGSEQLLESDSLVEQYSKACDGYVDAIKLSINDKHSGGSWDQIPTHNFQIFDQASDKLLMALDDALWFIFANEGRPLHKQLSSARCFAEKDFRIRNTPYAKIYANHLENPYQNDVAFTNHYLGLIGEEDSSSTPPRLVAYGLVLADYSHQVKVIDDTIKQLIIR